jgi:hypothetical protein
VDAGPATRMIDVAELSGAGRVKQTFGAGKSLRPGPPTERAAVDDSYAFIRPSAMTCGSGGMEDDWKKIRRVAQIVEWFLQIQRFIKIDLTETVADSASLHVA